MIQPRQFEMQNRYESLPKFRDFLEKLKEVRDSEVFRVGLKKDASSNFRPNHR